MLNVFRQMEQNVNKATVEEGLKPLKAFTPPPDDRRRLVTRNSESEEEEEEDEEESEEEEDEDDEEDEESEEESEEEEDDDDEEENPNYVRSSKKNVDVALQQAQAAARAKQLRAKFERWESDETNREQTTGPVYEVDDQTQLESTST